MKLVFSSPGEPDTEHEVEAGNVATTLQAIAKFTAEHETKAATVTLLDDLGEVMSVWERESQRVH